MEEVFGFQCDGWVNVKNKLTHWWSRIKNQRTEKEWINIKRAIPVKRRKDWKTFICNFSEKVSVSFKI